MEHIVEYNRFEGGNKFVTDGGMVYFGGYGARGNHVRYNLFHMFKATHQAVYFDTMGSGMYSYFNVISTLGALTNAHKGWYSSSGHEQRILEVRKHSCKAVFLKLRCLDLIEQLLYKTEGTKEAADQSAEQYAVKKNYTEHVVRCSLL